MHWLHTKRYSPLKSPHVAFGPPAYVKMPKSTHVAVVELHVTTRLSVVLDSPSTNHPGWHKPEENSVDCSGNGFGDGFWHTASVTDCL